ncbi:MAG: serine/threonine protein kinase [Myxococcales bacterium]|nr:serine/threonine protein kinase [Myxococcales bacterium]
MSGQSTPQILSDAPRQELHTLVRDGQYRSGAVVGGKYRLVELLGEGGMGAVWLAHNLTLDAEVAIKVIRVNVSAPIAAERLRREARAAARLTHPGIVRVFDFGRTEQGDPYIVMEVVRGESLGAEIERVGRFDPAQAVQLILPVIDALAAVHDQGIVHRDVKPDNIILVRDDQGHVVPKILDFGIAKDTPIEAEPQPSAPRRQRMRALTQAGVIVGSPEYMSPEQATGTARVGHAADIWATAVMLYELLRGERPFDGPTMDALSVAIIAETPVPLSELGIDPELSAIVDRGLRKVASERWPDMRAFGSALAAWLMARGVTTDVSGAALATRWGVAPPTPSPRRHGRVVALASSSAAVVLLLVAAVGMGSSRDRLRLERGLSDVVAPPVVASEVVERRLPAEDETAAPAKEVRVKAVRPPDVSGGPLVEDTLGDLPSATPPAATPAKPNPVSRPRAAPDDPGF